MLRIAKQIGNTLETTERTRNYMEDKIGEMLRNAAIAAKSELDPHIANVTNEQLAALSRKLGVDHITLWIRTDRDIVAVRSSDPKEINMGSSTWDYWYTAFNELFDRREVTVPQGQKLPNYWAGPIQFSTSDENRIDKWGYYYDGTTDYMINPYVDAKEFLEFMDNNGTNSLIRKLLADNPDILGIAGFDPKFFGKPPILREVNGKMVQNLDTKDIPFGEYTLRDGKVDVPSVLQTARTGQAITATTEVEGKHVMKSFIPLGGGSPYVIGVIFDHRVIERSVNRQAFLQSVISAGLIIGAWIASYLIAGILIQPLRQILRNVDEIAQGRFGSKIIIQSRDELGLLSSRVNTMADSLQSYTDRLKDTAEELRGTKEYLESFVGQTSDAIHVTDVEGKVTRVNKAFEKMFGWNEEDVLGQSLSHLTQEHWRECDEIRDRILRGEAVADHETVRLTKNGESVDVSITVSAIRDEGGEIVGIAEIARNITARKHTEEVIRRSEKLAVIGQLAAGVAHEIRNPLTTVRGFVQLQQQTGKLTASHLEVMMSELDRINFIVSEFLVLAKPQAKQFQPADLRSLMTDVVMLLDPLANMGSVEIDYRLPPVVPALICEPNQLKQVFINVLKNGVEAMPQGGTITIEMAHEPEEDKVVVLIRDQGCGIPEEEMSRIGEPFFTSKPSGNGLGLMVSQKIIANHKGTMAIRSKRGEGTTVEIRLPVA
ncbi:PAS domain S-box protein [Cohnella sp. CFH 77786]|nr:ATP-binding protein [Cohnella sp. CFH 77786]MBW5448022.1 PAS domain S-box protein [Cohnella sp. CFH 77786]